MYQIYLLLVTGHLKERLKHALDYREYICFSLFQYFVLRIGNSQLGYSELLVFFFYEHHWLYNYVFLYFANHNDCSEMIHAVKLQYKPLVSMFDHFG